MPQQDDPYGMTSPGGFVFGLSGWYWGEPRPTSITFFLDGTAKVSDQHGRPIKGGLFENKPVLFAAGPPSPDDAPTARSALATHSQVIAYLLADLRVDWKKLSCAGWPQLSFEELKKLPALPPTPLEELRKIRDPILRRDALRARRESDDARAKEVQKVEEE